ncbi:2-oxo acid dehydrogenase subunit E2 [Streptomyces sp. cg2]|uniref:dihydrolipoamide acetyltransferase family protein n=1 Tax=Streptomyces sp. cg2 TaxID=3238799 RepID=UPI0034E2E886
MTANGTRFREFKMPDIGEGLTEAEILRWYVAAGDTVSDGQMVCEVETAKAVVELPIPFDGVVHELRFDEGVIVDIGTVIISVDTEPGTGPAEPPSGNDTPVQEPVEAPSKRGEDKPQGRQVLLVGYGATPSSTKRRPRRTAPSPEAPGPAQAPATVTQAAAPAPRREPGAGFAGGVRPLAKPPVRKLAKDLGIDLATVVPSDPDGIITRADVHTAAGARDEAAARVAVVAAATTETVAATAGAYLVQDGLAARETRVPVKGVRKATAQAMVASAFTAPHVTEFVTVDVTRTMKLVEGLKTDPEWAGLRVNPLLFVAKALLVAIKRHPEINASWDEENQEIVRKDYVNLGIAAATPRGLIVPNIKDAGARALPQLAEALADLVTTAREGRTPPAAMVGGTVTITNVGVFGVDTGTPILNPGESAILAFGAVKLRPWVHRGKVKPRHVTTLALSFDHRLVDGELGSRMLADVAAILEQPKRLMWS